MMSPTNAKAAKGPRLDIPQYHPIPTLYAPPPTASNSTLLSFRCAPEGGYFDCNAFLVRPHNNPDLQLQVHSIIRFI